MRSILADTATHLGRFTWLAGALVASLVAFALTRPAAPVQPDMPVWGIGHCVDANGHIRTVRVNAVPSYRE